MTKWLSAYHEDNIILAAQIIRSGGLVAFPTETVYGLGANALDKIAVAKIFEVKGRPQFDPLIVHISKKEDIFLYAEDVSEDAKRLVDTFWPGPLTVVLKKKDNIPSIVTAGLPTVAIRMPNNVFALKLIEYSGVPIAAPSANPFGYISPTSASQVVETLGKKIDCILDGGKCQFGLESTVIMIESGDVFLLRPGALEIEKIEKILNKSIKICDNTNIILSPGQMDKHYSPTKNTILVYPVLKEENIDYQLTTEKLYQELEKIFRSFEDVFLILPSKDFKVGQNDFGVVDYLSDNFDLRVIASNLFEKLYIADKSDKRNIVVVGVLKVGLGISIMNRLEKASTLKI
ncbi:MAG: L-threonylcarbamoyladenylate synthase [Candidatus Calescibacterium sp.]|nr:L-threonylcarbamoyladenylate synthase [Candidatus Calescibacterium sp.]MCX7971685.1 L-threonylcarbamoyladenylate synthase [bacterium]MDW8195291.1 L-threonylcarbamoyladenylate synthase [Candidatus Calescibacterium sp.]